MQVILQQTMIMFLYMMIGYGLIKSRKLTDAGSREMANLLIWLVIPTVIINSFCVDAGKEKIIEFGISTFLGAVALLVAVFIARVLYGKRTIDQFAAAFSNAGFIGIPLVKEALGEKAVFYLVGMIAMLNILQWTYGAMILTGKKQSVSLKNMLFNPIVFGTAIGLILFLTGFGGRLPSIISQTIQGISAINAPVAMIVLGTYLAKTSWKELFTDLELYKLAVVRLILIPIVTILIFKILPGSSQMHMAIAIGAGAPVGANVAVYSQINHLDYAYACRTVAFTTILSIVVMPVILMLV